MTRFCRFCGQELRKPGVRFCQSCGRELAPVTSEAEGVQPPPEVELPQTEPSLDETIAASRSEYDTIIPMPKLESAGQAPPVPPSLQKASEAQQRLIIRVPGQVIWEIPLNRTAFSIGRKSDNDIVIPVDYVSGHHGRLELRSGTWHFIDLGSTNGTYVNGQLMQSAVLEDGDILRVGDIQGNSVSLTYREAGEVGAPPPPPAPIRMGATALGMQTSVLVGRDPQAGIHLPAPVVSWHHARLDLTRQGHVLVDLGSTNGTFVNGQRLTRPQPIQQGDVVQIGPFKLVYEATGFQQYTATGGVRLDGVHLVREVGRGKRRKRILKDIDISVYPREFISLVGTSGAGKSTLMMALNGFVRADGQVMVNGDDLYRQFDLYRALIGYVPQDDIIHRELTVGSALRYAARLRLPADMSKEEIERRVDTVLQQVGMIGQKDQAVSSLSGGQRKRVSIAVELLAEPRLFFLDEPTSGLDPGLEKQMMHTLRQLADGGRTVVLVTHATANISQCDHVCFLSQGRMVYFGPPEEAFQFFEVTSGDFADIYGKIDAADPAEARRLAEEWEDKFRQSHYYERYVADRQQTLPQAQQEAAASSETRKRPRVNPIRQFFVLTRRYLDLVFRDKLLLTILLAIMPLLGLLLLLITEPNWLVGDTGAEIQRLLNADLSAGESSATYVIVDSSQRLLFMMALAAVLLGLFAAAYEVVKERSIYQRERMVTLRLIPYLASKVVVLSAFALAQCLLLLVVIGFKVQLPMTGVILPAPLEMYVTLVIATLAAIMMGLFISSLVPNTNTVIYVVLLLLFFQIIFAGVIFAKMPDAANRLSMGTLTRWTMEGLGASTDMDFLNSLTRTRFQPDPVTEEVSVEVERPSDDWEPVTVVTETQEIEIEVQPGIYSTVPISVPEVTVNDMVSVTETVTEEVTVTPDPLDIFNEQDFVINFASTTEHLLQTWAILLGFALAFGIATLVVLKRKDVG